MLLLYFTVHRSKPFTHRPTLGVKLGKPLHTANSVCCMNTDIKLNKDGNLGFAP